MLLSHATTRLPHIPRSCGCALSQRLARACRPQLKSHARSTLASLTSTAAAACLQTGIAAGAGRGHLSKGLGLVVGLPHQLHLAPQSLDRLHLDGWRGLWHADHGLHPLRTRVQQSVPRSARCWPPHQVWQVHGLWMCPKTLKKSCDCRIPSTRCHMQAAGLCSRACCWQWHSIPPTQLRRTRVQATKQAQQPEPCPGRLSLAEEAGSASSQP